ncbi:MAG: hypothetical protein ACK2T0_06940 [Anaerolineales bacterium]
MSMEDIMKALMQSTSGQGQQQQASQGSDALSQVLGGLLGGAQQGGGQQAGGSADMLSQALGGLLGGAQQSQQGQQSSGAAGVGQLLGGLQQIIGGTPGTGQQLPMGGGNVSMGSASPVMMLLQPVVTQLAEKAGLSPQIATVVASIAVHYLLQSHPNTPGASPLNLGSVMQTLSSGGRLDEKTLQSSGMVDDVMHATGMDQKKAVKTLSTTFDVLGGQVPGAKGPAASKTTGKKN